MMQGHGMNDRVAGVKAATEATCEVTRLSVTSRRRLEHDSRNVKVVLRLSLQAID